MYFAGEKSKKSTSTEHYYGLNHFKAWVGRTSNFVLLIAFIISVSAFCADSYDI